MITILTLCNTKHANGTATTQINMYPIPVSNSSRKSVYQCSDVLDGNQRILKMQGRFHCLAKAVYSLARIRSAHCLSVIPSVHVCLVRHLTLTGI